MSYTVVWFKRDLRLHDHAALMSAAAHGPLLCLYVVEPSLWVQPDAARQHHEFILESLHALARALKALGGRLHVRSGEVPAVLAQLHALAPFARLVSHEETGNAVTFERDQAVARWCRAHGVGWQEFVQFGVVRRLKSRNHWQSHWATHTQAPQLPSPAPGTLQFQPSPWAAQPVPSAQDLGLDAFDPPQRQRGGRSVGLAVLDDFLNDRCRHYRGGISSPLSAPSACSRLSPYLSFGCVSLREVVQATDAKLLQIKEHFAYAARGLEAFLSRLHWHCHFIQKLESEPELEWRNVHRGYDGLREPGWLNFRMRAMLVSVAAYPLWLHWQPVGQWLARQFLDYEPGIHWSQMQTLGFD
ncbi:MAG: deoxyribodipyrimidine photo-lyase [Gammaproteobacteria bacterium]|uniref:deoxyribodipyrimidine photo-lyase n=1 Tax=Rhodoferax sp. TaxID=50421 RepID=UPI00181FA0EE|nr:hypothetical protein [Rhodoferax sp.]MBU3900646.1 deoxyribodipyrimidine photo-lyase [Gammaproteobacteria bacterium]MBU3996660.1 deoxyribodipyrimidine photo-lyase [Gammaproteobacteria bacterium]MBU4080977.1 deoxyribodipyrimidine photo-lyase [Gammaproteobacteria bacterium]MBU4112036.1 deoxyribodipyrimidine photo-lyase [Gammaproteobacteria bacterium]